MDLIDRSVSYQTTRDQSSQHVRVAQLQLLSVAYGIVSSFAVYILQLIRSDYLVRSFLDVD